MGQGPVSHRRRISSPGSCLTTNGTISPKSGRPLVTARRSGQICWPRRSTTERQSSRHSALGTRTPLPWRWAADETMAACILDLYRSAVPNTSADWRDSLHPTAAPGLVLVPSDDPFGDAGASGQAADDARCPGPGARGGRTLVGPAEAGRSRIDPDGFHLFGRLGEKSLDGGTVSELRGIARNTGTRRC